MKAIEKFKAKLSGLKKETTTNIEPKEGRPDIEIIPPKRRKHEGQYRENLYRGHKKVSRKERQAAWDAAVDAAFAASKR